MKLHERYQLSKEIGSGAMGMVYLARDRVIDRQVVLKTLRDPASGDDGASSQRLIDEARSAGRITHPNVVTVYDVLTDEDSGRLYLALEYVEGRTLSQILARSGKLSVEHAGVIVLQIAAGLQHLHEAGLIHRDIKPSNILVDGKGVAKITDFGIARAAGASQLEHDGTVFGTPPYMAPEQLLGQDLDASADVYSLGAVFYEMVSGRKPIEAESVTGAARGTLRDEVPSLADVAPELPHAVRAVIARAMSREVFDRFSSMTELAAAVRAATGISGPIEVTMSGELPAGALPPPPDSRLRRRNRALAWLGAGSWATRLRVWLLILALVLAIGLASGWWLFERAADSGDTTTADLALEARALEAVLLQEGQRLLLGGDPGGALTVAALVERLSPRSDAAQELRTGAEALAVEVGVPEEALRKVEKRAEDPVRAAREVLGDSRQADEVSAALARLTEAREALAEEPPGDIQLELELRSEAPRGSVVIFANGKHAYSRRFSFSERRGVFARKGVPGELRESFELPPGEHELLVYVTRRGEAARLTRLSTSSADFASLLRIHVPVTGDPDVRLE